MSNIPELTTENFDKFIDEVYGYKPFPWQRSLARKVIGGEGWPDNIDIPTGAGKTMVVDIAVYHLAKTAAENEVVDVPRRIFHTVDRRLIVDNVYTKGLELKEKLDDAEEGSITERVADGLRKLSDTESVLNVARLRGGAPTDRDWVEDPTTPVIVATTVDHLGSRLLFRGYGVSDRSKPVHAGLTGNDSLHILDEAHLSEPMEKTLEEIKSLRSDSRFSFETVSLSATTKQKDEAWPTEEQLEKDRNSDEIASRLEAEKKTTLHKTDSYDTEAKEEKHLVDIIVESSEELIEDDGTSVLGAIVNRVGTARRIFDRLNDTESGEAILLTGRVRPQDREDTIDRYLDRIGEDRERSEEEDDLFVVATQTIEVGVNIDFDAMVTELAPVDSLKQRFGRLDRYGEVGETECRIVARHSHTLSTEDDPVYGDILSDVYDCLKEQDEPFDMGNSGVSFPEDCPEYSLDDLTMTSNHRPALMEPYMEKLNQTSPIPDPDSDISLFIHGVDTSPGEVDIVWRSDIPEQIEDYEEVMQECPPSSKEILSLPIWAFSNWMRDERTRVSDIEGISKRYGSAGENKEVFRWDSDEGMDTVEVDEVSPGDLIVLPSEYGGYDEYGFNQESKEPVKDIGNDVSQGRTQLPVRIHPSIYDCIEENRGGIDCFFEIDDTTGEKTVDRSEVESFLRERDDIDVDIEAESTEFLPYSDGQGILVIESSSGVDNTEIQRVTLPDHTENVVNSVREYAESLDLPEPIRQDIVTAAEYHDIGKADERFQRLLHGGDVVSYRQSTETLAKSGMNTHERREARRKAEYPSDARHEALSASLIEDSEILEHANDPQLVLHLVASHHGYHRPFIPTSQAPESLCYYDDSRDVRLEADLVYHDLLSFADLTDRYGYWGLSYIEAVLRAGDRKASQEEKR